MYVKQLWIFIFQFLSLVLTSNNTFNIFPRLKSSTIRKVSKLAISHFHPFILWKKKFHEKGKKNDDGTARGIPLSLSRNDNRGRNSCSRSRGIDLVRRPFRSRIVPLSFIIYTLGARQDSYVKQRPSQEAYSGGGEPRLILLVFSTLFNREQVGQWYCSRYHSAPEDNRLQRSR